MSTPAWEEALWAELDAMSEVDQFRTTGEWFAVIQDLLSSMGRRRRLVAVRVVSQEDWDATKLAESTGTRRSTVSRLVEEGRAILRRESSEPHPSPVD